MFLFASEQCKNIALPILSLQVGLHPSTYQSVLQVSVEQVLVDDVLDLGRTVLDHMVHVLVVLGLRVARLLVRDRAALVGQVDAVEAVLEAVA